jgi:hypothetical protein
MEVWEMIVKDIAVVLKNLSVKNTKSVSIQKIVEQAAATTATVSQKVMKITKVSSWNF